MKLIKLTDRKDTSNIYINIDHIGAFYQIGVQIKNYKSPHNDTEELYTRVGVTTHNNGGFDVKETPEEIIKMCNKIEDTRNGGKAYTHKIYSKRYYKEKSKHIKDGL